MSNKSAPHTTPARYTVAGPVLFISDLHLSPALPRTVAAFERFLAQIAIQARTVIILGDFFEFWVGDDERHAPFNARIIEHLRRLAAQGVAIYLVHGNRDFLIGKAFAEAASLTLLPDPALIQSEGQQVLVSHGDVMCTDDLAYMRLRRWTRKPWVRRLFLALPLSARLKIAQRMRARSASHDMRASAFGDVTPVGVQALFSQCDARTLIHGHTHRPACHNTPYGQRWVLGDWDFDHGTPRADALRVDMHGVHRVTLDNLTP